MNSKDRKLGSFWGVCEHIHCTFRPGNSGCLWKKHIWMLKKTKTKALKDCHRTKTVFLSCCYIAVFGSIQQGVRCIINTTSPVILTLLSPSVTYLNAFFTLLFFREGGDTEAHCTPCVTFMAAPIGIRQNRGWRCTLHSPQGESSNVRRIETQGGTLKF